MVRIQNQIMPTYNRLYKFYKLKLFNVGNLFKFDRQGNTLNESNNVPVMLYIVTILFYIFYQILMQPNFTLGGEMWAEMATDFFKTANNPSYFKKIFDVPLYAPYVPLPQRLIAFAGNQLHLPAKTIPFFYTWSCIIITCMMVATFCLARFRILVRNDYLRFFVSISILLVADFETRTFLSFTYFSAFFATILACLAFVDDKNEIPYYAWTIPILITSKPITLAALPCMILVATASKRRFRDITIVTIILTAAQVLNMSRLMNPLVNVKSISIISRLIASFEYFFGFLGGYILGHNFYINNSISIFVGIIILVSILTFSFFRRNNGTILILAGVLMLYSNTFITTFGMSDSWNLDLRILTGIPVFRHIIPAFFSSILIICGILASYFDCIKNCSSLIQKNNLSAFIFLLWFFTSGWFTYATIISKEPVSPTLNNSQWQNMSTAIDAGISPLCVPLDPWWPDRLWVYGINCSLLQEGPLWSNGSLLLNADLHMNIVLPDDIKSNNLISTAVLVAPYSTKKELIDVKMLLKLSNGNTITFSGARDIEITGGLILLTGKDIVKLSDVYKVELILNKPAYIAMSKNSLLKIPGIAWFGN